MPRKYIKGKKPYHLILPELHAGASIKEVSEKYKIKKSLLKKRLRQEQLPPGVVEKRVRPYHLILPEWQAGATFKELAHKYQIPKSVLKKRVLRLEEELGVVQEHQEGKSEVAGAPDDASSDPDDASSDPDDASSDFSKDKRTPKKTETATEELSAEVIQPQKPEFSEEQKPKTPKKKVVVTKEAEEPTSKPEEKTTTGDTVMSVVTESTEASDLTNGRGGLGAGTGSFRSRGGFRGGYRGRRGGSLNINLRHFDAKAMYLCFEKPINSTTANEIMDFGKDAASVGFGRGCILYYKTPEEAKEVMDKVTELKFGGLEPKVEYAYKKREVVTEKRSAATEDTDTTNKKPKVEGEDTGDKEEDKEEEAEGDEEVEGNEEVEGDEEVEGEEGEGEEVEGEEGEGEEVEGEEAEGEVQDENEEYEGEEAEEEAEDDIDEDEYKK